MSETEDIDNNPFIQQYVSPLLEAMILDMFTSQPLPQNLVKIRLIIGVIYVGLAK